MKDWAKLLSEALAREPEKVPRGWKTVNQIAKKTGDSPRTVQYKLFALTNSGRVTIKKFLIRTGQRLLPVPHYKIKRRAYG